MSVWESVGDTYAEGATSMLPVHRLAILACGFYISCATYAQTHFSVIESIYRASLVKFFDMEKGVFASAQFSDIFFGIISALAGWAISRCGTWIFFELAEKTTGFSKKAGGKAEALQSASGSLDDWQKKMEIVDSMLEFPRRKLKILSGLSEFLGGIGVSLFLVTLSGNMLDAIWGFFAISGSMWISFRGVAYFLDEYIGPALYKAKLQGRPIPGPFSP